MKLTRMNEPSFIAVESSGSLAAGGTGGPRSTLSVGIKYFSCDRAIKKVRISTFSSITV